VPREKRISERKIILFTAGLLIFAGLIRLIHFPVGIVLFYLSFLPYYIVRIRTIRSQQGVEKTSTEKYRFFILVAMFVTLAMNIVGWAEANFFVIFLLMVDFMLVTKSKF
jgi:hypothetical protein